MRKSFIFTILLILILLSGFLNWSNMKDSILLNKLEKQMRFEGIVEEIKFKEIDQSKYRLKIIKLEDGQATYNINENIMLKIIGEKEFELGDIIVFDGKAKDPMTNTNPKLFNYKKSLLSDRVYTTMTIKDYDLVQVDSKNKEIKYKIKSKFRKDIERIFDYNLNRANSSLMKSIVLGEYDYLEDEDVSKYRDLGLAHILAVSGLHIGIIAAFLVFFLSHLGMKRRWVYLITLGIIWFYGFLIGFPPSLLRANIMMSILFLARSLAEPNDSMNSLLLSMCILLIINPFWIFKVGFQLSYLATFSIIYFTPRIQKLFYPYKNKQIYALSAILGVQVGLIPIQAYYFNELPILTILANLIIAPLLSLGLVLGAIMVGIYYSIPGLNNILGLALDIVLNLQFKLVDLLHKIPFGRINIHSPSISEIVLYYVFILILFKIVDIRKLNKNIKRTIMYYLLFYIVCVSIFFYKDQSLEIHFIDVGQGDSILIKNKKSYYLIDTGGSIFGNFDIGKNITLPYLKKNGIMKLNGVFISHFHEDHSQGLPLLIDKLKVDNVLISYGNPNSEAYNHIIEKNIPVTILRENDRIVLDKNTSIEVLSPTVDFINRNLEENDLSLVFLLKYFNREILFTGDMEKEVENYLLDKFHRPVDIIKVPHHGSNTSSDSSLLEVIKPKIGVITVGRKNMYGHPQKEVLDRYDEIGTEIFRTDTMGMIKVLLNKEYMKIERFLQEEKSFYEIFNNYIFIFIYYLTYYLISYILIRIYVFTEEKELS